MVGGTQDQHIAKLTISSSAIYDLEELSRETYACPVPKMLVTMRRGGTASNAVVLRMAA